LKVKIIADRVKLQLEEKLNAIELSTERLNVTALKAESKTPKTNPLI